MSGDTQDRNTISMSYAQITPSYMSGYGLVAGPGPGTGPMFPTREPGAPPAWVAPVVIVGFLGLVGMAIYFKYKLLSGITEKYGVGSAIGFQAAETGLGLLSSGLRDSARRNPRRTKRTRRKGR